MKIEELANGRPLDAVIIGGGINGSAIAAEAAARGLRVALFEAADFGFGTTWRSTRLIHGGLRYLEHGDLRLVFESLHERTWLLKTRPYLVRPQRFLLPRLPWTRRPAWQLRTGLALYDMLSFYRGVPSHRSLSHERLTELAPYLSSESDGGFSFFDARVLSPERLALELALRAQSLGASVFNQAAVRRICLHSGRTSGVEVEYQDAVYEVAARTVINAAGPWVDAVNEHTGLPMPDLLSVTRGTHIVLELNQEIGRDAIFSTARSDGRVFFTVPQQDKLLLVGTTDDRYAGDPGAVAPTPEDLDYLLDEAQTLLPGLDVARDQIRYAFAGLRPLQRVSGGPEAAITRRHAVIEHREQGGPAGLLSIVGGKLSTFRPLARDTVSRIEGADNGRARLDPPIRGRWREEILSSALPRPVMSHLRIYGEAVTSVLALGREPLCEHAGAIAGEITHAVRNEQATTLSDILMRRTGIAWSACRGLCCHEAAANLAAIELGWGATERKRQVKAFEKDVEKHLPTVDAVMKGKKGRATNH
ncbi:MAG TPA: glycerol-3-phosphate dehydrogenase/oxidase [Tepidiformaceae bacterium]|nr:glycerol-3-phosphate dehydrogenase/oxidase [Tepidiformaceae bacterium]